jgi:hypothetical protein
VNQVDTVVNNKIDAEAVEVRTALFVTSPRLDDRAQAADLSTMPALSPQSPCRFLEKPQKPLVNHAFATLQYGFEVEKYDAAQAARRKMIAERRKKQGRKGKKQSSGNLGE